ncbi:MAG: Ktr system potassium transporter B [Rhodobacteraceae bacterium]|nr:Ktr system potassium transporter B [Paracoccaceae bacterium]MAY45268.1 Ktr system potassium transporter B [Paracoccaceae bacterium]
MLAALYGALVLIGAGLLKLPVAAVAPVTWSDALFTATSAVTVTGLAVLDTGSQLTFFGQVVIMVLIQLGGLGLMTFAVLVLSMLGLRVSLSHRIFLREDLNQTSLSDLLKLVRGILKVVLICEGAGVVLLSLVFVPEFGLPRGLWFALFHTISAFNNAGFALFPDSLSAWVGNPVINIVIPALFIFGGLGFIVVRELSGKPSWRVYSLHTKLMIVGTLGLIVWSVLGFGALEWTNPGTLGGLSFGDKLWASWFQGVTTRTAGFNTIDIAAMHDSTAMMFMSLMVIGGGSTSTAGGIKVTSFIVLILATIAFFKRRTQLHIFGRSLGPEEVMKVLALAMTSILTVFVAIFVITISHDGDFLDLVFEVTSAFGTVGLSRGTTPELNGIGRAVIIVVMFIGRVGPLTLGFFLATRSTPRLGYPSSRVHLG